MSQKFKNIVFVIYGFPLIRWIKKENKNYAKQAKQRKEVNDMEQK